MRGHGLSGKPETDESYQGIHYAEDFDAVSKAFNLHKPIHVGWSFGGALICLNCGCLCVDLFFKKYRQQL
jgi:pimeloyl-ACP methyl ester carboxylesterase